MRDEGMTLIEVLVAVLLLGTVLVVLGAAVPAGFMAVTGSGLALTATGLAQEPLDVAKRTPFTNLSTLASSRAVVPPPFSGFEREVLVSNYFAPGSCAGAPCSTSCSIVSGQATCRTVEVRVYYRGPLGDATTTMTQIFAQ
jgi:prepilin-type N-terminal cleavage/methylation domain-containing protein